MKLYLVSQEVNSGYDTYDSFVVCATDEDEAKIIHELDDADEDYGTWVKKTTDIKVKYLGEAEEGLQKGEILSSFNAG